MPWDSCASRENDFQSREPRPPSSPAPRLPPRVRPCSLRPARPPGAPRSLLGGTLAWRLLQPGSAPPPTTPLLWGSQVVRSVSDSDAQSPGALALGCGWRGHWVAHVTHAVIESQSLCAQGPGWSRSHDSRSLPPCALLRGPTALGVKNSFKAVALTPHGRRPRRKKTPGRRRAGWGGVRGTGLMAVHTRGREGGPGRRFGPEGGRPAGGTCPTTL